MAVNGGSPPVVLILRALGLGDFLTGVPAYRALARAFPGHRMVLAAPAALEALARHTGVIDELLPCGPLKPLPEDLPPPAVAVNLHGSGPQSHRILLKARPGRLIAFASDEIPATADAPVWKPDEHEVCRWARLLCESGVPCDPAELHLPVPEVKLHPDYNGATVIHPGAASEARCWPVERWAQVAWSEAARGRRVLITGGTDERARAQKLAALAGLPRRSVIAGDTDLVTLSAIVGSAARLLCSDTGVAHLATSMGTPSVVLFGPTSPALWGPPPDSGRHRILWSGAEGDPHAGEPHQGLLRIRVGDVLRELDLLSDRADFTTGLAGITSVQVARAI